MMSDSQLIKISFLIALIGLACLFALYVVLEPEHLTIKDITLSNIGHEVVVTGSISSIAVNNDHVFITLSDNSSSIKVVVFANTAKNHPEIYNLTSGVLTIQGKVDNYKGELEIVANKIGI